MGFFNRIFNTNKEDNNVHLFETEEWKEEERKIQEWEQFQAKVRPIYNKYFPGMDKIQVDWSILYNLNDYNGKLADKFKTDCETNIELYRQMFKIEREHGQDPPANVPAFKRLAMLYEKQGDYEKSVGVCIDAINSGAWGDGMRSRLARMIKKAGRKPTTEEMSLLEDEKV